MGSKMHKKNVSVRPLTPEVEPVFWFIELHRAVVAGNFQKAQQATEALKRLGIHVRYGRPVTIGGQE